MLVDEQPPGYPELAAFLESDTEHLAFRGFNYLRTRLLLEQQEGLIRLEWELDETDKADHAGDASQNRDLRNRVRDKTRESPAFKRSQDEIFESLYNQLERYGAYDRLLRKSTWRLDHDLN